MHLTRLLVPLMTCGLACSGPSPEARREAVLEEYIDAVNQNSIESALAFHTPDAEFIIPGQAPIRGTTALRNLLRWDSVLSSEIHFEVAEWLGDTLLAGPGWERNGWFTGIGVDSLLYAPNTRFVFEGDLIRGIYPAGLREGFGEQFDARWGAFFRWAEGNAPEAAELAPGGQFTYTAESAERWLGIMAAYTDPTAR